MCVAGVSISSRFVKQEQWERWRAKRKLVSGSKQWGRFCDGPPGYNIPKKIEIVCAKSCNLVHFSVLKHFNTFPPRNERRCQTVDTFVSCELKSDRKKCVEVIRANPSSLESGFIGFLELELKPNRERERERERERLRVIYLFIVVSERSDSVCPSGG